MTECRLAKMHCTGPVDGGHVEAYGRELTFGGEAEIFRRGAVYALKLALPEPGQGRVEAPGAFDLAEHVAVRRPQNEIDFAALAAPAPRENLDAALLVETRHGLLRRRAAQTGQPAPLLASALNGPRCR